MPVTHTQFSGEQESGQNGGQRLHLGHSSLAQYALCGEQIGEQQVADYSHLSSRHNKGQVWFMAKRRELGLCPNCPKRPQGKCCVEAHDL